MERDILSLKNIYRFLMVNDYPAYSEGVIREKNRKGLTLVKFWQDNLLYEFRSGKYGRMIWRNTGSRNRYLSEMCNRSERLHLYREYMQELTLAAEQELILSQIRQTMSLLTERHCSWDAFVKKLDAMLQRLETCDSHYTEEVAEYFRRPLDKQERYNGAGVEGRLFYMAWYLTFWMLHAMTGEYMNSVEMQYLRLHGELSLDALWEQYCKKQEPDRAEIHFLTGRNNEICAAPLPQNRFFGREEELFDLRERLTMGGRYLLSGMGGIGKTELLRQLLRCCCEEGLVEEIAIIQYDNNLAESMTQAFGQWHGKDLESNFQETLAKIRRCRDKKTVIFIDNMNQTMEKDSDLKELLDLPATIFMTSRLIGLDGFETYLIQPPSRSAGMLIFRDNYGKALTAEDRRSLQEIMSADMWRHTLTIRLLGHAAKVHKWSVTELRRQLEQKGLEFSWTEGGRHHPVGADISTDLFLVPSGAFPAQFAADPGAAALWYLSAAIPGTVSGRFSGIGGLYGQRDGRTADLWLAGRRRGRICHASLHSRMHEKWDHPRKGSDRAVCPDPGDLAAGMAAGADR